jgi:hypothetical protein
MTGAIYMLGYFRRGTQDHCRRGNGIIRPVMFSHCKYIETCLIGQGYFFHQVPKPFMRAHLIAANLIGSDLSETVDA